ncbi:MAG: hypothetical protein KKA65_03085 [Nanoarchaeota archaeon]|nr:hypothetical protein [Nanoarchaeota archaeon]MBU4241964.1 hypothetical protein [Nanoarchaeota archaeon]MBU4352586.1 hypothetical protein [Nanoarchaeota archaeon]MBU4456462.1 hypothetical protein [Nanoarchaeota archaeon]MCG2720338.1 hypothetical protein [Nanoarchaeota archaeon]
MSNNLQKRIILKRLIIQKLIRSNVWGGKHIPLDFTIKGIPEHFRNRHKGKRIIEKVLKELIKDRWIIILIKKIGKGTGKHLSLNPKQVNEIKKLFD